LKPTVIFVSYGTNESFEGEAGLPKFEKGLEKLLDALKPAKARVVLFTPLPFREGVHAPDPKEPNRRLEPYVDVVRKVAKAHRHYLADLFTEARSERYAKTTGRLTEDDSSGDPFQMPNGMHL